MSGFLGQGGVSPVPGSAQGNYPQYFGVYYGSVSNNADPLKKNRCLLRVPQLLGGAVTTWAVSLTPQQNPPKVGTLIACVFVGGDLDNPAYMVVNPKIVVETTAGNIKPIGTTPSAGTSTNLAAADHVHGNISTTVADFQADGTAAVGATGRVADAGHIHPQPNPLVVANLDVTTLAQVGTLQPLTTLYTPSGFAVNSVSTPTISSVSYNFNDPGKGGLGGSTWLSGERGVLNSQIDQINANFSAIVSALQSAGIWH